MNIDGKPSASVLLGVSADILRDAESLVRQKPGEVMLEANPALKQMEEAIARGDTFTAAQMELYGILVEANTVSVSVIRFYALPVEAPAEPTELEKSSD